MKKFILVLALPFVFGLAHAQDETPAQTPNQYRAPMYDGQGPYGPRGPGIMDDEEARKYRDERREQHREEMREQYQQRPYGPGYQRGPNQSGPAQRPATPPQQ